MSNNAPDTSYIHMENLRFMDFNGDAAVDIVNQFLNKDNLYLEFWKNTGKGFDLLIQLQGEILEFKKDENSKGFTFLLYHEICCSDTHHIKKYRFDPDQETFQLTEAIVFRGVVKPDDKKENLNIPVEMQDSFTLYELRFSGPNFPIGLVKGGAEGTILAEFTDLRNGKWYCVKLNPNVSLAKSRYGRDIHRHADYTDFGVQYVGWVKAGLVTIKQQ